MSGSLLHSLHSFCSLLAGTFSSAADDQHMADAEAQLREAKLRHEDTRSALWTAEWAVHDAHVALQEASKEMLRQELVVWHAAEKSQRAWGMCPSQPPTLVCTGSRSCPGRAPR
eukprot:3813458-Rhodomonas_salina.5